MKFNISQHDGWSTGALLVPSHYHWFSLVIYGLNGLSARLSNRQEGLRSSDSSALSLYILIPPGEVGFCPVSFILTEMTLPLNTQVEGWYVRPVYINYLRSNLLRHSRTLYLQLINHALSNAMIRAQHGFLFKSATLPPRNIAEVVSQDNCMVLQVLAFSCS